MLEAFIGKDHFAPKAEMRAAWQHVGFGANRKSCWTLPLQGHMMIANTTKAMPDVDMGGEAKNDKDDKAGMRGLEFFQKHRRERERLGLAWGDKDEDGRTTEDLWKEAKEIMKTKA